jgi:hypothetical protein
MAPTARPPARGVEVNLTGSRNLGAEMAENEMAEKAATQVFPRRDAEGRVVSLAELLAAALLGTLVAAAGLALIDGVLSLIGLGTFGRASGWLAAILPALLFFDEIRAWHGYGVRFVVGLVAAGVAIGLGLIVAALVATLPALVSGTLGAAVAAVTYAFVWFVGIRRLTGQQN